MDIIDNKTSLAILSDMKLEDYVYNLPDELIAQEPADKRDESRLMVLDRSKGEIQKIVFKDITQYFKPGDAMVINDTKVIPARLIGKKKTGGKAEVFLLEKVATRRWKCLVKPGKRLKVGTVIDLDNITAEIVEHLDNGERIVEFNSQDSDLFKAGKVPLPPYVHNEDIDRNRYQTVYADVDGAVAAPTAGLHFTPDLLDKIKDIGVEILKVTLHVGLGTFRPIKTKNIDDHAMEFEWFSISEEVANRINDIKSAGGDIFACGTTVVRSLESNASKDGLCMPGQRKTNLFIKPGFSYRIVDHLITNFHLPGSTLLLLVSAFANREQILQAYEEAIDARFRFFSFGDSMLIL
jgi:S-adenosylmethionine:tRNA ribosyltransferase-isomerase